MPDTFGKRTERVPGTDLKSQGKKQAKNYVVSSLTFFEKKL